MRFMHRSHFINCRGEDEIIREIHVREWGGANSPTIIMWHGLTRNGGDFGPLARAMAAEGFRVIAPDTLGRGLSAWAENPKREYSFFNYAAHAVNLMDALGVVRCGWVGVSMGGLLGMHLAAEDLKARIERLIIVDIGPVLGGDALSRIGEYLGTELSFNSLAELENHLRQIYAPFGELSDAEWREMTVNSWRRLADGKIGMHYDVEIAEPFRASVAVNFDAWPTYEKIPCPILVLRGEHSDFLPQRLADEMASRHSNCRTEMIPHCGHAPYLNTPMQIRLVREFLKGQ